MKITPIRNEAYHRDAEQMFAETDTIVRTCLDPENIKSVIEKLMDGSTLVEQPSIVRIFAKKLGKKLRPRISPAEFYMNYICAAYYLAVEFRVPRLYPLFNKLIPSLTRTMGFSDDFVSKTVLYQQAIDEEKRKLSALWRQYTEKHASRNQE